MGPVLVKLTLKKLKEIDNKIIEKSYNTKEFYQQKKIIK